MARASTPSKPSIPDPNLRLAVAESLFVGRLVSRKTKKISESYDRSIAERLLKFTTDTRTLARVSEVYWSWNIQTAQQISSLWDGEGDEFSISRLRGVELLPNLRSLCIEERSTISDLKPLLKLPNLTTLSLHLDPLPASLTPLTQLKQLQRLDLRIAGHATKADERRRKALLKQLAGAGVEVGFRFGEEKWGARAKFILDPPLPSSAVKDLPARRVDFALRGNELSFESQRDDDFDEDDDFDDE